MRHTCQVYGSDAKQCGLPAVDFVLLDGGCEFNKIWMCCDHWDNYKGEKVLKFPTEEDDA